MPRTEVRKECPSCGLGVPLDAKACGFCGWNFDEEDEWISEIDQLEQDLITEKQKFEDTSVDKMIQSTLRKTDEKKGEGAVQPTAPAQPVKMKKIAPKPASLQTSAKPPEATAPEAASVDAKKEPATAPSGPVISKPRSYKIDVERPRPAKSLDLELNFEEPKSASVPEQKQQPSAEQQKPAATEPLSVQTKPEAKQETADADAPIKHDKVVRRVVKQGSQPQPMIATGEARKAVPSKPVAPSKPVDAPAAKPATPSPSPVAQEAVQQKPAQEKPKPPVAAQKPAVAPAKEEKKSHFGFGKMFSHEKQHTGPEKIQQHPSKEPVKQTVKVFICPLCNKEVLETERKCPNCGAEFE
jgi:hypothetical protein